MGHKIHVGGKCNNNCLFCKVISEEKTLEEIMQSLTNETVFTGGEVTIRKDFFKLISLASETCKNFLIQSNARMFASEDFTRKAVETGAHNFLISVYGYNSNQHDYITRTPKSFRQTVKGINNLANHNVNVSSRITITKSNYRDLKKIVELMDRLGVKSQHIYFEDPALMMNNFHALVPKMQLIAPSLNHVMNLKGLNSDLTIRGIPPCIFNQKILNNNIIKNKDTQRNNKIKLDICPDCKYNEECDGVWQDYTYYIGTKEFSAIK